MNAPQNYEKPEPLTPEQRIAAKQRLKEIQQEIKATYESNLTTTEIEVKISELYANKQLLKVKLSIK